MRKADGMMYAPKGKPNPVCEPGEFRFACVGLDHGHIYGMTNGLTEAGGELVWVYDPDPVKARAFCDAYPQVKAAASEEQVLAHWSGLGYYARGRNLHATARVIVGQHRGEFPRDLEHILELPGIGRSTAAAICALAYHERRAILDGNVRRVLARYCGIEGWAGNSEVE